MSNAATKAAGAEVERFAAPAGRWLGFAVIGLAAVLIMVGLLGDSVIERNMGLAGVAGALISWVVLVRPVASIRESGVLLRNMTRDIYIPAAKIVRCRVFQTLQVVTEDRRFHGLGVTRSARSMVREQHGPRFGGGLMGVGGAGGVLGGGGGDTAVNRMANQEQTGGSYHEYVESRIMQMVASAKPDSREAVTAWDLVALGALGLAAALIALAFVWS